MPKEDKMMARDNNGSYEKKYKLTLRYDDGLESMINTITKRDGISKSECVRRGIMSLYEPGKSDVLPQLCNLCSVVNKLIEEADMDLIAKESMDIKITLNTYGHLYPNQQKKLVEMLNYQRVSSIINADS